jgi:hypothetical protein
MSVRPDFKRKGAARRQRCLLREIDELPQRRDVFPWKPFEVVIGPSPVRRPPLVEREDNT